MTAVPEVLLDPQALARLRELDPTGSSRLLERVVKAFNKSVEGLLPQLLAAQATADMAGIRHVAHTLKSSSASLGAVKLSALCADLELMAKDGRTRGMDEMIPALVTEVHAVLEALKSTLAGSQ